MYHQVQAPVKMKAKFKLISLELLWPKVNEFSLNFPLIMRKKEI